MTSRAAQAGHGRLFVVLLAGGKGTRFWPGSTAANPKQFLKLVGDRSLLRLTFERFSRLVTPDRILVVTGSAYAERTFVELPELPRANLIIEPSGRDTAPAAVLGAEAALSLHPDPLLVVAPTDHYIQDEEGFLRALDPALEAANRDALVTFGIVPDRPATTYGYIEVAEPSDASAQVLTVLGFREKPNTEQAARLLASGRHFWNAGIFVWSAQSFKRQFEAANPGLWSGLGVVAALFHERESREVEFRQAWESVPAVSIDYALMEKAAKVALVPLEAGWSDVGSWDAVRDLMRADDLGNREAADVLYISARDCSVHREAPVPDPGSARTPIRRLYALVGVEGLIVVETPEAVLICRKDAGESMREVVKRLSAAGRQDLL